MEEIKRMSQLGRRIFNGNVFAYEHNGVTYVLAVRNKRKYRGCYAAFIPLNKKRFKPQHKSQRVKNRSYSYQSLETIALAIEQGKQVLEFNNSIDFDDWYCPDWELRDLIDKRFWIPWV